ncbi:MAG: hypothetical protein MJE63_09050 [Proteobacteria bacterium]|nr:hypothetical protein [Pseudomonadota bacterium]
MLESHGASRILASFHDIVPNWVFAGLYFSDRYIKRHPDNIRKLLKGMVKSFEYIKTNEQDARKLLPKYTKVKEELCMIAALREYEPTEPIERINIQKSLMLKYGYLKSDADVEAMLDYSFMPNQLMNMQMQPAGGVK